MVLSHRPVALDGDAEVALDHLRQPLPILDEERIVQVVHRADGCQRCRVCRPCAKQGAHRVAGRDVDQREDAEGDQKEQ